MGFIILLIIKGYTKIIKYAINPPANFDGIIGKSLRYTDNAKYMKCI